MKLMEYEVLYAERGENAVYVCTKPSESKQYRVIESTDKPQIAEYIKYFVTQKPSGFYEDFCLNEKYYAVFGQPDGIPLDGSGEQLTARMVLRALAMQDPPLEIAVRILSRDHIFICGDDPEFAYDLPETKKEITREYFFSRLADFIEPLMITTGDRQSEKWFEDLKGGKFESLLSAYRHMPDPDNSKEISAKDRYEKIKEILPKIAALILAAAAAITAVFLALDQGGESGEDAEYDKISSLGTIDLTEEGEP